MNIENDALMAYIFDNSILLDKELIKIEMLFEDKNQIRLYIKQGKGDEMFVLSCNNVKEFYFFNDDEIMMQSFLITHVKLFKLDQLYYLSLDPVTEEHIVEDDNYFILFEKFVGYKQAF